MNYSYLADGTKISALDDQGNGLEYRGSLTFRRNGSNLQIEGIDFPGGRFVAQENGTGGITLIPHYHITDHLGSVRAVVDGSTGQVVETNDYYPFGKRWDSSSSVTSPDNRFRFNGKEDQSEFGSSLSDYGARQYSASNGRWLAMDSLAEKYYSSSPYAFCGNNPVNFVDPNGEIPLLANLVGAFVSAGVEYGSQVITNVIKSGNVTVESFTNVDIFDIGVAIGEGFITSGANVAKKVVTKTAVGLAGEIARNAVNITADNGTIQTPTVNSAREVLTNTAVGIATELINIDVKITPFKGKSNTKAVKAARKTANVKGESLSPETANVIRKRNLKVNAEKAAANKAISEIIGTATGTTAAKILEVFEDENID